MDVDVTEAGTDAAEPETASAAVRAVAAGEPGRVVLEVGDRRVTYAELDVAADRLAQRLVADLGPGHHRVALHLEGTHPMLVASLAVARAGMVAVPIDPAAPAERVRAILADVGAAVVLTDLADAGAWASIPVAHPLHHGAEPPPGGVNLPRGPIVAIAFTSGSTGTPKGIMIPEPSSSSLPVLDLVRAGGDGIRIGALVSGTVGLSASGLLHYVMVLRGTIVAYDVRRFGTAGLGEWLDRQEVFAIATVPTLLREVMVVLPPGKVISSLSFVVLYGETSTWEDVAVLRQHLPSHAIIYNLFGMTETGFIAGLVITSDMPIGAGPLPIGQPFSAEQVILVGDDGLPVPDGEPGEIVVTKAGAALGYWARPDLTRSVFSDLGDGTTRIRTGDAGRRRPDGVLEHIGRLDHLVKISGNRVELGEIEVALRSLDGVADAAVTTYTAGAGDTRLTGYVVPAPGRLLSSLALRAALARRLPGAMLPDGIDMLDRLPQLANGKVDRVNLPPRRTTRPEEAGPLVAPMTPLQVALAGLWCDVLGVDEVGIHDDFFELGGDSIRAARIFTELQRRLGVDRPISVLLEAPTIAELASVIEAEASPWHALVPIQPGGSRPPLFVVHDGLGDVFYARLLSRHLGPDQPVYGLRAKALSGVPSQERTIEEVASSYVEELRRLRQHGPYFLYGWSLGGVIGFEMGRQLEAAGEQVALVGLGDSTAPGTLPEPSPAPPDLSERLGERWKEVRVLPASAGLRHGLHLLDASARQRGRQLYRIVTRADRRLAGQVQRALANGTPLPQAARGQFAIAHYGAMMFSYHPATPFEGPVLLVRAEGPGIHPDRGWGPHLGGDLEAVDVLGLHGNMGKDPMAAGIAAALGDAMARVTVSP